MNSVIFTSYFSKKIHPNDPNDQAVIGRSSDGRVLQNDISYIEKWYNSIIELNLEARIFYDNLSDDFINQYTTDKIKFVKVEISEYSNNDWRFFCYKNYLENNKFDNIFLTDSSDVIIVNDPTQIINDNPLIDFFICKDSILLSEFSYSTIHKKANWENYMYFLLNESRLALINMGVIGGNYDNILNFLNKFCDTRIKLENPDFNSDMWVGQYVFRHLLSNKNLMIGEPFTSKFKKYEVDRKDVYFIHK
jgi:hypothetical protein